MSEDIAVWLDNAMKPMAIEGGYTITVTASERFGEAAAEIRRLREQVDRMKLDHPPQIKRVTQRIVREPDHGSFADLEQQLRELRSLLSYTEGENTKLRRLLSGTDKADVPKLQEDLETALAGLRNIAHPCGLGHDAADAANWAMRLARNTLAEISGENRG